MSIALQQKLTELEKRVVELEATLEQRTSRFEAILEAVKKDMTAPSFPPLAVIPPFPRSLRLLGLRPPGETDEMEKLAAEMSDDELDPPEENAQVEGADAPEKPRRKAKG